MTEYREGFTSKKQRDESKELVEIQGILLTATDKAYLVLLDEEEDKKAWLPKSQCEEVRITKSDEITCEIPRWLAEKVGAA